MLLQLEKHLQFGLLVHYNKDVTSMLTFPVDCYIDSAAVCVTFFLWLHYVSIMSLYILNKAFCIVYDILGNVTDTLEQMSHCIQAINASCDGKSENFLQLVNYSLLLVWCNLGGCGSNRIRWYVKYKRSIVMAKILIACSTYGCFIL